MHAATLPRPAPTDHANADEAFEHYYCCDPDLALCGADIGGVEDVGATDELDHECPMCVAVFDQPCGNAGCPDR